MAKVTLHVSEGILVTSLHFVFPPAAPGAGLGSGVSQGLYGASVETLLLDTGLVTAIPKM